MEEKPKTFVWRNRDKKDLMGLNRGKKLGAFPLPSDYTVGHAGELMFVEVKSCSGDRFPYAQIEPGQRSAANISAAIGTPYWFFIYSMKLGRWFQLSGAQFAADIKAGIKSRSFQELDTCTMI